MVRHIIALCDKIEKEANAAKVSEPKKAAARYVKSGFIEGAVNGACVVGFMCAAAGIVTTVKELIKK